MVTLDFHPTGRHFLQIPGPSPVPDRILRAMSLPTIDHRGPEFGPLGTRVIRGMQKIFQTKHPVLIYPASGSSFNAVPPKAIEASKAAKLPKAYWAWDEIIEMNKGGYWPSTPNTNLLYGLAEGCDMILDPHHGGLPAVFERHKRWGEGVR